MNEKMNNNDKACKRKAKAGIATYSKGQKLEATLLYLYLASWEFQ